MSRETLFRTLAQLTIAISICEEKRLQLPTLMLIYAGIDICGWLASGTAETTSPTAFTSWVEHYLLPAKPLPCTSMDLYAARCGLLHTYTPESRLSDQGAAKRLAYAWGNAKVEDLEKAITKQGRSDLVAVHASDLLEAFRLGLASFVQDLDANPALAASFDARAKKSFAAVSVSVMNDYLDEV